MKDSRRPRHIRDIAHLYLSKKKRAMGSVPVRLLVAAQDQTSFSAFHVANIAAAMALRKARVRIHELSGILPNACFYFCHPPHVYMGSRAPVIPGLHGIDLSFDLPGQVDGDDVDAPFHVTLVHLPPFSVERDVLKTADTLTDFDGETWAMLLVGDDAMLPDFQAQFVDRLGSYRSLVLSTGVGRTHIDDEGPRKLGGVFDWEASLPDRVPIVLRSPEIPLSLTYLSVCDSLLGKMVSARRRHQGVVSREAFASSRPRR